MNYNEEGICMEDTLKQTHAEVFDEAVKNQETFLKE